MVQRVYVGPHDEVELVETGDFVRRGESVEVDAELAARLDEQPTNWAKPSTKAAKSAPKPKHPAEPDQVTIDGQSIKDGE